MYLKYITRNSTLFSILIFFVLFCLLYLIQPQIVFDNTGCPRDFGIGWKNKTIMPLWLITILLAILSYFIVLNIVYLQYF